MRETNKAKQAFEDYFNLGPGRSLTMLHEQYRIQTVPEPLPPTKRLPTLKSWSSVHDWQERIAEREAEIATAAMEELKISAKQTGYAMVFKRIADLNDLAEKLYGDLKSTGKASSYLSAIREFRAILADIAAEMGERAKVTQISGIDKGPIRLQVIYEGEEDAGRSSDD